MNIKELLIKTGSLATKMTDENGVTYKLKKWQKSDGRFAVAYFEMYPNDTEREVKCLIHGKSPEEAEENMKKFILG